MQAFSNYYAFKIQATHINTRKTFQKILAQVNACARLCYPDVTPPRYLGVISLSAGVLDSEFCC